MTHDLAKLLDHSYQAGALEQALRGCLDQHPLIREASEKSARDLLRQIDAARSLSPEMFAVVIEAEKPWQEFGDVK